jgi:hypothetical protein
MELEVGDRWKMVVDGGRMECFEVRWGRMGYFEV